MNIQSSSQEETPLKRSDTKKGKFNDSQLREQNIFRQKIVSSQREAFQKTSNRNGQNFFKQSNSEIYAESELIKTQRNGKDSLNSSQTSVNFDDDSEDLQEMSRVLSFTYFNQLPEANPIINKTSQDNSFKFQNVQSIYQLNEDENFLQLGQISSKEPLQMLQNNFLQYQEESQRKNSSRNQNDNSSNSSTFSSLEDKVELDKIDDGNSSDTQKLTKEGFNTQVKQQSTKLKLKKKKKKKLSDQINSSEQNEFNEEGIKDLVKSRINSKLLYKKQNQHMLVNLQNSIQVIKESTQKKCFINDENQRNENLIFDSKIESGNLASVYKLRDNKYNLQIQQDINTNGYTQWFYFKVSNRQKQTNVLFNIGNFYKKESLFQQGMKISIFSKRKQIEEDIGWFKGGYNIKYQQQQNCKGLNIQTNFQQNGRSSYILQFNYNFQYEDDDTFFAYTIPYTYSQLQKYLQSLISKQYNYLYIRPLCNTILNNQLYIMTITNPLTIENQNKTKKGIFITARVHPGETVSSYVLEGLINFLLRQFNFQLPIFPLLLIIVSQMINLKQEQNIFYITFTMNIVQFHQILIDKKNRFEYFINIKQKQFFFYNISEQKDAQRLREQFIFKIVPMLNPDGVIHGNYRCSLAGCDLNRRWKVPIKNIHPEIYYTKRAIYELNENYPILFYCDVHGHSKKKDFFLYGCQTNDAYKAREYPFIVSKLNQFFDFKSCDYRMYKSKEATSRQTLFRDLNIDNIFTLETSFCGPSNANYHFSIQDLKSIGQSIGLAILCKFSSDKMSLLQREKIFLEDLYQMNQNQMKPLEEDIDGSDSEPSCDNLDEKQLNVLLPKERTSLSQQQNKKKKKKNNFQKRMVLTKYFSKSPAKILKEDKTVTEIKQSRPATQQSERKQQPIHLKTQETDNTLNTDSSPKIYNFIYNPVKKTQPKQQQPLYQIVQPTIFHQLSVLNEKSLLPQALQTGRLSTKQKQIFYQNEKYQKQKTFFVYQSQLQSQKEYFQEKQRQLEEDPIRRNQDDTIQRNYEEQLKKSYEEQKRKNYEEYMRKNIEDYSLSKSNFKSQNAITKQRRCETPQPHRYHSSNQTRTESFSRNGVFTLPDQDYRQERKQKEEYDMKIKENELKQIDYLENKSKEQQEYDQKIKESQFYQTTINNYPKSQMKNSYMSFLTGNNKKNQGNSQIVSDVSQAGSFNSNIFKGGKQNQLINSQKSSSLQRQVQQQMMEGQGIKRIRTVVSQHSPKSSYIDRYDISPDSINDSKIPNAYRAEVQKQLKNEQRQIYNDVLYTDEEMIQNQLENNDINNVKTPPMNQNNSQIQNQQNIFRISQSNNKQYLSPERNNINEKQNTHQQKKRQQTQTSPFNNSNNGRNSISGNPVLKNIDLLSEQRRKSKRKDSFQSKNGQQSDQKEQQNVLLYNSNNPKFSVNSLVKKLKQSIDERSSSFKTSSQDQIPNIFSNIQLKNYQNNLGSLQTSSNNIQLINSNLQLSNNNFNNQKVSASSVLYQKKSYIPQQNSDKNIPIQDQIINLKVKNKLDFVYVRKRSQSSIPQKLEEKPH